MPCNNPQVKNNLADKLIESRIVAMRIDQIYDIIVDNTILRCRSCTFCRVQHNNTREDFCWLDTSSNVHLTVGNVEFRVKDIP